MMVMFKNYILLATIIVLYNYSHLILGDFNCQINDYEIFLNHNMSKRGNIGKKRRR
jgi:hypothetical protein